MKYNLQDASYQFKQLFEWEYYEEDEHRFPRRLGEIYYNIKNIDENTSIIKLSLDFNYVLRVLIGRKDGEIIFEYDMTNRKGDVVTYDFDKKEIEKLHNFRLLKVFLIRRHVLMSTRPNDQSLNNDINHFIDKLEEVVILCKQWSKCTEDELKLIERPIKLISVEKVGPNVIARLDSVTFERDPKYGNVRDFRTVVSFKLHFSIVEDITKNYIIDVLTAYINCEGLFLFQQMELFPNETKEIYTLNIII